MTMTRKQAGRLGALKLSSDPYKKSMATKKAANTRMKKNPNAFREMGAKGGKSFKINLEIKRNESNNNS